MALLPTSRSLRSSHSEFYCRGAHEGRHQFTIRLANTKQDKKIVASNIEAQAKHASILFIWTDCDREGEHIGTEIRDIALKANRNLQIYRARFSNIERA
jgi:DNA topoisomerase IA